MAAKPCYHPKGRHIVYAHSCYSQSREYRALVNTGDCRPGCAIQIGWEGEGQGRIRGRYGNSILNRGPLEFKQEFWKQKLNLFLLCHPDTSSESIYSSFQQGCGWPGTAAQRDIR